MFLVFALIAGVNIFAAWQKQKKKHARGERENPERDISENTTRPVSPLEELLRKFEEAQRKREQEASEIQPPVVEKVPPPVTKKETPPEVKTLRTEVKTQTNQVKPAKPVKPVEVKKTPVMPAFTETIREGLSETRPPKKTPRSKKEFSKLISPPPERGFTAPDIQFNREGFYQGFLWSKILEEPRFRNRWRPKSRA